MESFVLFPQRNFVTAYYSTYAFSQIAMDAFASPLEAQSTAEYLKQVAEETKSGQGFLERLSKELQELGLESLEAFRNCEAEDLKLNEKGFQGR